MKNKEWILGIIFCVLLIQYIPSTEAFSFSSSSGYNEAFNALENPTAADLKNVPEPTATDFQHLLDTNPQEAVLYLVREQYNDQFAEMYIDQQGLNNPTREDALIAEKYFTKNPPSVQNHADAFSAYMASKGVGISFAPNAEILSYYPDGTITTGKCKINIKEFSKKYSFAVNDDGSMSLRPLTSSGTGLADFYVFTGTAQKVDENKMRIMGEGTFGNFKTKDVSYLWVDDSGRVNFVAKAIGGMEFDQPGLVTYVPHSQLDGKEKFIFKGSLIKGTTHTLSGDVYFDTATKKYYAGEGVLTVDSLKIKRKEGHLVEIEVYEPAWYEDASSFISATLGKDNAGQKTRVSFNEKNAKINLESQQGDVYSASASQNALQNQADEVNPNTLTLPSRGYYQKGDTGEGVKTIQRLLGFRDEQITGMYDDNTIAAVRYFQTSQGTKVDGYWGKKTRDAYLASPIDTSSSVELIMNGGVAQIGTANDGMSIDVAGSVNLKYKGKEYSINNGVIDTRLGKSITQTGALTLTTRDANGESIATVDQEGLLYSVHDDKTTQLTAVEEGFINGEFNVYQAVGAHVPLLRQPGDNCAAYTTASFSLLDGSNGFTNDYGSYLGFPTNHLSLAAAAGVMGNTWNLEENMVDAGGSVVFDKRDQVLTDAEQTQLQQLDTKIAAAGSSVVYGTSLQAQHNQLMGDQVVYSNDNFLPGDVVTMYYGHTRSLYKAVAVGQDTTHSGVVLGSQMEYSTYDYEQNPSQDLRGFVSQNTEVTNPTLLGNYPVEIMDDNGNWRSVTLASDNKYYYSENVDTTGKPVSGAQRVTLTKDTDVAIKKTYVTDNVHGTMGSHDINQYFNDNSYISLSQVIRPDQKILSPARDKQLDNNFDAVQVTNDLYNNPNTYEAILRQRNVPEEQIPALLEEMNEANNLRQTGMLTEGDIIVVPQNPTEAPATAPKEEGLLASYLGDVETFVEDITSQ